MKIGKKNVVNEDLLDYNIGLIGESGIGKTTVVEQMLEKLLDYLDDPTEGYLFLETGKEDGADAISNINYVSCPSWKAEYDENANTIGFGTLVDDIIENKDEDYKDLRVIVVDTYDELRKITEKEVIRLHNRDHDKKVKTIKAAFGGYMAGDDMADDMILDKLWELKSVGVHFIIIGHTKMRNAEDDMAGEKYTQLTTDMPIRSFNKIKNKLHFLGVAYKDRTFVSGNKEKTKKIDTETRKINFRDDNYSIDSKSRFADIVSEVNLSADEFITAMQDAIKKEISKDGKTAAQRKKDQKAKQDAKKQSVKKAKENHVDTSANEKMIADIMDRFSDLTSEEKAEIKDKIGELKKEIGFKTFSDLAECPTVKVKEVYDVFVN